MKSETTDESTLFKGVKKNQHAPILDEEITLEEIEKLTQQQRRIKVLPMDG